MSNLIFKGVKSVDTAEGVSILEAALSCGVEIYHTCGGNASCGTCRVRVLEGSRHLSPIESAEAQVLDAFDLKSPYRLGCQAVMTGGDVKVEIPQRPRAPRPNKTPRVPQ